MASLAGLLDCGPHRANLSARVDKVETLLRETHAPGLPAELAMTARGLSFVLLFAAYEQLLTSLCRSLLETTTGLRVGVRRLTPGFKLFSVFEKLQGISDTASPAIWRKLGPRMIETLEKGPAAEIPTQHFPSDGSFMKRSQVTLFCSLFELDAPGPILKEVWSALDTVVVHRNDIAHGTLPADDVGRAYSRDDMLAIAYLWKVRWTEFVDAVETKGASRDFYRRPR